MAKGLSESRNSSAEHIQPQVNWPTGGSCWKRVLLGFEVTEGISGRVLDKNTNIEHPSSSALFSLVEHMGGVCWQRSTREAWLTSKNLIHGRPRRLLASMDAVLLGST